MKPISKISLAVAGVFLALGCSLFSIDPVINDHYVILPATDADFVLVFHKPLSWGNGPDATATHSVLLPKGIYSFEGKNDVFRYFRSPTPLTMGTFRNGARTGGYDFDGGVAIAISKFSQIPAEAYVSRSNSEKVHVMRLGYDFALLRGEIWDLEPIPR